MTGESAYNPDIHHRRSIRKKGYDYSDPGVYYITICSHNRERLFGAVEKNCILLNGYGEIVRRTWYDLVNHVGGIKLDAFVVMPNHFHGIVVIGDIDVGTNDGAGLEPAPTEPMSPTGITLPTIRHHPITKNITGNTAKIKSSIFDTKRPEASRESRSKRSEEITE